MKIFTIPKVLAALLISFNLLSSPSHAGVNSYGLWAKVTSSSSSSVVLGDQVFLRLNLRQGITDQDCEFDEDPRYYSCNDVAESIEGYLFKKHLFGGSYFGFKAVHDQINENVNSASVDNVFIPSEDAYTRGYNFSFDEVNYLFPQWSGGGLISLSVFLNMASTTTPNGVSTIEPTEVLRPEDPAYDAVANPSEINLNFSKSFGSSFTVTAELIDAFKLK